MRIHVSHSHLLRCYMLFLCAFPALAVGQSSETGSSIPSDVPTIHVETQLVTVDVTVRDKNGQPVHGLNRDDFTVVDGSQTQTIRNFEEKSLQKASSVGQALPPLPPGTFSDYSPFSADGPLNILLLDSLNTSMADQGYVRYQLQQYVKKAKPGTKIAIFGLSRRLYMLQGFNSDPEILKDVVEHKLISRPSNLLDDALGSGSNPDTASDIAASGMSNLQDAGGLPIASVISNMQQFEADEKAAATQMRIQYTLDAFNALAHYLSAFPGRKNLIWFSSSFPLNVLLDPTMATSALGLENDQDEFRETSSLLSKAEVAVYPLDARGLVADATFSAATRKGDPFGTRSSSLLLEQSGEHATMNQIAEDTGGKAFYNTNDLATAVQNAIDSGSNYYTLTYNPTSRKNGYKTLHVALNGKLSIAGYSLEYRHGYFTDNHLGGSIASTMPSHGSDGQSSVEKKFNYVRVAMAHGAPTPQDILFKVRVLAAGAHLEQTLAQNNTENSARPIKPPFRRYSIDMAAVPDDFQLSLNKDGNRTGSLEFSVLLYDSDGTLLNSTGKAVTLDLTPERFRQFLTGVNGHFEISVPVKAGDLFLRIGVRDIPSNKVGVVEVPISSVAKLPPLPSSQTRPSR